jgi:hypothetical protein
MVALPVEFNIPRAEVVKRQAAGQWQRILQNVCGLTAEQVRPGYRGPCPQCGGDDRFSPLKDVAETGGLWCRGCHNADSVLKAGDGLAAVQWLLRVPFTEALRAVADELRGLSRASSPAKPAAGGKTIHQTMDAVVGAVAWGLQQNQRLHEKPKPANVWTYYNAAGAEVGAVVRWDLAAGKEIRQLRVEGGGWVSSAMNEPRPLYGLPLVAAADPMQPVFIVEGEKSADAGQALNLCCITSSGGSSAATKTDWKPVQGRPVVIIPDNDEPGESYAADVARLCLAAGASSVAVLRLPTIWPDCPPAGDLADFSEAMDSQSADQLAAVLLSAAVEPVAAEAVAESVPVAVELFEIVDSAEFDAADLNQDFWIEGILAAGQPQLWAGPSKSLKTSLLVDQCLSLAAGVPFLGQYTVPEPKRVLLLSSESGNFTLQENARRICAAKGLNLAALGDHLQWGFRPPQLTDVNHLAALTEFIGQQKFDLVAIDPAYLSLAMDSAEAANQFAVGALLQRLTTLQAETGAVPVLAAHFKKFNAPGELPTLENIAGAGFGQWARQWFLLNRQEPFNPDNPGFHKLLAAWGGSAGHCGGLAIHVTEGLREHGRYWDLQLQGLGQTFAEETNAKKVRQQEKKLAAQRKLEEDRRQAVLTAMKSFPDGATKTKIRQDAKLNSDRFEPIWTMLQQAQEVCPVVLQKTVGGKVKEFEGWRLMLPEDRLKLAAGQIPAESVEGVNVASGVNAKASEEQ